MTNWNKRFIELAQHISTYSKDSHPIGAVIVDKNNRIISTGFNGFAKGIKDTEERLNNKDLKRMLSIHAEANAITFAKQDLTNCKIYIYGYMCCVNCASLIIQSGITEVFYKNSKPNNAVSEYWKENLALAEQILSEANVKVIAC